MTEQKLLYELDDTSKMHIILKGFNNYELRDVLIGFWLILPAEDRADFIAELQHYSEPASRPPELSQIIARACTLVM